MEGKLTKHKINECHTVWKKTFIKWCAVVQSNYRQTHQYMKSETNNAYFNNKTLCYWLLIPIKWLQITHDNCNISARSNSALLTISLS